MAETLSNATDSYRENTEEPEIFKKSTDFVEALAEQYDIQSADDKDGNLKISALKKAPTIKADLTFIQEGNHFTFKFATTLTSDRILLEDDGNPKTPLLASILIGQAKLIRMERRIPFYKTKERQGVQYQKNIFNGLKESFFRELNNPSVTDMDSLLASDANAKKPDQSLKKAKLLNLPVLIAGGALIFAMVRSEQEKNSGGIMVGSDAKSSGNFITTPESYISGSQFGYIIPGSDVIHTPTPEPVIFVDPNTIELRFDSNAKDPNIPLVGWNRLMTDYGEKISDYYRESIKNGSIPDVLKGKKPATPRVAIDANGRFWPRFRDSGVAPAITFDTPPDTDVPGEVLTQFKDRNYIVKLTFYVNYDYSYGLRLDGKPVYWIDNSPDINTLMGKTRGIISVPVVANGPEQYMKIAPDGSDLGVPYDFALYLSQENPETQTDAYRAWQDKQKVPDYFLNHVILTEEIPWKDLH